MNSRIFKILLPVILVIVGLVIFQQNYLINNKIKITYPWNNSLFPADIAAPTIKLKSEYSEDTKWLYTFKQGFNNVLFEKEVTESKWRPESNVWDSIKKASNYKKITLIIKRLDDRKSFASQLAKKSFSISVDSVNSPILYREIPIPFSFAEMHIDKASYSLYNVSSYKPPHVVLEKFNVCGNCHSLTGDGKTIGLDFDASTRDKGGYFVADIDSVTLFNEDNYLSWTKLQKQSTFGLFSKISWDGRYIVTTIKDRVISKKMDPVSSENIGYSQVFFPVNGILAVYDRETGILKELNGANDRNYVQSNAIWTPDGEYIIFARAKAIPYPDTTTIYSSFIDDEKIIEEYVSAKKLMRYDLYKVPFNNGEGGEAIPIKGASNNDRSNYFPAISPDGKWLAYCQSNNLMMLRPDSRLHMVSLETGKSEDMKCNLPSMNSWHAWSPNGKWMVYSSKTLSYYTDMFLTHVDENGKSSIPVLLENSHHPDRAVNYPEFVNVPSDFVFDMKYDYVNIRHIYDMLEKKHDTLMARKFLERYLEQDQYSTVEEYYDLGKIYQKLGEFEEAERCFRTAYEIGADFVKEK